MSAPAPAAGPRGELAAMTARILINAGLPVTAPDDDHPLRILIFTRSARYTLQVSDDARAELHTDHDNPRHAADTAAALLAAPGPARHPDAAPRAGITFKGIAGMRLRAQGLRVALNVYTDDHYYDVTSDIAAINPSADTGTVYINDNGGLNWYRDFQPDDSATESQPRFRPRPPDPAAVARDIAAAITLAATASPPAASAPEELAARFIS